MAMKRKRARTYGPIAAKKVADALRKAKRGKLHAGRSGAVVTGRKQAIAIGLSEARHAGGKVPTIPEI